MRKLRARGYRRIGLLTSYSLDERMDRMWTAAYPGIPKLPESQAIPIHLYMDGKEYASPAVWKRTGEMAVKWYRDYKPDAILTTAFSSLLGWLTAAGYRVPQDVAVIKSYSPRRRNARLRNCEPPAKLEWQLPTSWSACSNGANTAFLGSRSESCWKEVGTRAKRQGKKSGSRKPFPSRKLAARYFYNAPWSISFSFLDGESSLKIKTLCPKV